MNFTGTVLVVDDEAHIRKFVGLILKSIGIQSIIEAGNGLDALSSFSTNKPALVLLDVNMAQIDGLETLRRLKQQDPDCVVIMLTSLANRYTVEQAIELGAANYIRKDTPKDEIAQALIATIEAAFGPEESAP